MVKRGGITMKCWDLGGQAQYRAEWGRYTRGCNVIVFVVDAHAMEILPDVKIELHRLLEDRYKSMLHGIFFFTASIESSPQLPF
jgi:ADP-ribosylation factor-like protein 8